MVMGVIGYVAVAAGFFLGCAVVSVYCVILDRASFRREREAWLEERKSLLDRIQSGGLAEYVRATAPPPRPRDKPGKVEFL